MNYSPKISLVLTVVFLFGYGHSDLVPRTTVELYEHSNYGGETSYLEEADVYCYYLSYFDNRATSIKVLEGSCAVVYDGYTCSDGGEGGWYVAYPDANINFGSDLNDRVSSVTACGYYRTSAECPPNTYVRVINYNQDDHFKSGVELHCYGARDTQPAAIINTHSSRRLEKHESAHLNATQLYPKRETRYPSSVIKAKKDADKPIGMRLEKPNQKRTLNADEATSNVMQNKPGSAATFVNCPSIVRLHSLVQNGNTHTISEIGTSCEHREEDGWGKDMGITGIEAYVEYNSNLLKELVIYGVQIPNPADFCPPRDDFVLILDANNLEGTVEREFAYTESVGVAKSLTLTEEERKDYEFSSSVGFNVGGSGSFLSANFYANYNESESTGFSWGTAQSQTWQSQTTATIKIPIPAHTHTKAYQVVGRCTFFEVAAYSYKFVDYDGNGNVVNVSFKK